MAEALYLTWADDLEKSKAYAQASDNIHAYDGIQKSYAYDNRTFIDVESSRSVRPSFYRNDYTAFRPGEAVPTQQKRIMKMCMAAYDKVGIVRNVIDLMGDFASQGLTLVHPNKSIERFYRKLFDQVNGHDRSERFLNYLYRCGNVAIKRRTAKINKKKEAELKRSTAAPDMSIEEIPFEKRTIPWKYDFLNPLAISVKNKEAAMFTGDIEYVLKVSKTTINSLMMYNGREGKNKPLPQSVMNKFSGGERDIPLDKDKLMMFHYKKDDWNMWANPMIYAILDDIIMLEKMKLADLAALDGAISNVRLWRIGDLDHKIIPTKAAINKLRDILASNVGGGTMDLVWGPEIDFKESSTQVYKFLGSEKYQPVLTSVYAGLGIPPTLTGAAGASGGYTNNYVSLKTLIERLEYGREILKKFWQHEIKLIQKAMGFRFPAEIHFDSIILSDEAAQKQLLVQLADRDIISHETLLERFREIPNIEKIRVRREEKARVSDTLSPNKAGPYHNPQHKEDVAKIALTKDILDKDMYLNKLGLPPSEVDEVNKLDVDSKQPIQEEKPNLVEPEGGRPLNSRDTKKRKQKRVLPRSGDSVATTLWAYETQKTIAELVTPMALTHFNKKTARSLTKSEFDQLEYLKLCILTGLKPFMEINADIIKQIIDGNTKPSESFRTNVESSVAAFSKKQNRKPNIDEMRYIYASVFTQLS